MWKTMLRTLEQKALTSTKFLVGTATVITLIVNGALKKLAAAGLIADVSLDSTTVYGLVVAAASYLVGQGIADHGKPAAEKSTQLAAAIQLDPGPTKDAVMSALAGVAPKAIENADSVKS